MTIRLQPEVEDRLKREAARQGMDASDYAAKLLDAALPKGNQATLDLLAQWDVEDATDDPAEIARRRAQWEEFKRSMNDHSVSERAVYP